MMGLEYATGGKMEVARPQDRGHREGRPDSSPTSARRSSPRPTATTRPTSPIGPTGSGVALAMLPVAEEYKKILIVEPAVADSITGDKWNRYIFRTGRNSLAGRDLERGRDRQERTSRSPRWRRTTPSAATASRRSRKRWPATGAKIVHEEYAPQATTDFTAPASACSTRSRTSRAARSSVIIWAGAAIRCPSSRTSNPSATASRSSTGGNILPALAAYKALPGMEGATYYYYEHPEEPGQRLAGRRAPEALQRHAAGLLHRGRHVGRHRRGRGAQEGRRHRHREADRARWKAWRSRRPRAR